MTIDKLTGLWRLHSSVELDQFGASISSLDFNDQNWSLVSVPSTVVGALVECNKLPDPYYGTVMQKFAGYKIGRKTHFAFHEMANNSPYKKPFWFRRLFSTDKDKEQYWIDLDGINYKANVWLNGKLVASTETIIGPYRQHKINVTNTITQGINCIAIELFAQRPDELGITFIDWCPVPPDDSMGIWQPVSVYRCGTVRLTYPCVVCSYLSSNHLIAKLVADAQLYNSSDDDVNAQVSIKLENCIITKTVKLPPRSNIAVHFSSDDYRQLCIKNPRLWWPWQLGKPILHNCHFTVKIAHKLSDKAKCSYGIRRITSTINKHGARQFNVNGHNILIRGTAWSPDLMLKSSNAQDEIDIAYLKNMNMNTIRFEGKLGTDRFWEICDREGIMVLAGWPCCTHWEKWDKWKMIDHEVATESLRSQLFRLRSHASFAAWFYGSDYPPPEDIEQAYLDILDSISSHTIRISNATAKPSVLQGNTGVKMSGPYGYVPPSYWYNKNMPGYADNFNTETGPDVSIPVIETLEKFLPNDERYPGSPSWNHHAGLASFLNTDVVNEAVKKRYGNYNDLAEFAKKAQLLSYECWRAMYEAYGRNYPNGTGVIGWMHNAAWPSVLWQLYDYYNEPTGGFFGSKKGCESFHIQYSYDDNSIWLINNKPKSFQNINIDVTLYTYDSKKIWGNKQSLMLNSFCKKKVLDIPNKWEDSPIRFLFLKAYNLDGISSYNCYWLPRISDIYTESNSMETWFYWPLKRHADLSTLMDMKKSYINFSTKIKDKDDTIEIRIFLDNISENIAHFIKARIRDCETNKFVVPVYWSDNCISLEPFEKREIFASIPKQYISKNYKVIIEQWR